MRFLPVLLATICLARLIPNWNTCNPSVDTCNNGFVCCIAPDDVAIQKFTCRQNTAGQCSSSNPHTIDNWSNCNPNTDKCNQGFVCCIAPPDISLQKYTCRQNIAGQCHSSVPNDNLAQLKSCLGPELVKSLVEPNHGNYSFISTGDRDRVLRKPSAVLLVFYKDDIQKAVKCAVQTGIKPIPRSGGHSYESLSSFDGSLVIDIAALNKVQLVSKDDSKNSAIVNVQAGARLGHIYKQVYSFGKYAFNAGSCPSVGIGGHISGGGYGMLSRMFGLASDQTVGMKVVLANGEVVNVSESENQDLFWALRGGGSGSFGFITEFNFRVHKVALSTMFILPFSDESKAQVMKTWMNYFPRADNRLTSELYIDSGIIQVKGRFVGPKSELDIILQESGIMNIPGLGASRIAENCSALGSISHDAGDSGKCDENYGGLETPIYNLNKERSKTKSEFVSVPFPEEAISKIIDSFRLDGAGWMQFGAMGGKIGEIAKDATPFYHRESIFEIQYVVYLQNNEYYKDGTIYTNSLLDLVKLKWIQRMEEILKPFVNGGHYQNYPDLDLGGSFGAGYFGPNNFKRLKKIKRLVDPTDLFRNEQSIPLE